MSYPILLQRKNVPIITEEKISELEKGKYQIDVKGNIDEKKI